MQESSSHGREKLELARAFRAFTELSWQLEGSYRSLQNQVAELGRQLESARAERRAKAKQAKQLARRLELLLATLPAGVVVLDEAGSVLTCNPAARKILGEELIGRSWSELRTVAFKASPDGGESMTVDGRRVTILTSASSGEAGRIVLLTDVTERRALEALVNRNDRLSAMGKMAASLAHQIRTPLASALLYLSQCRRGITPAYAETLERGIERLHALERLVQDMLVFARGDGSGERFRIADLFRDVYESIAGIVTPDTRVEFSGACALQGIEGNRSALVAALTNLVRNGLEAAPRVRVMLEARLRDGWIEVLVRDDGPGIAPEIRERVFEPFFSTRPTGTGLGLALAKTVAEAHGGRLELHRVGRPGTTIGLVLPAPRGATAPCAPIDDRRNVA